MVGSLNKIKGSLNKVDQKRKKAVLDESRPKKA